MSDTKTIVEIKNGDEFRTVAKSFGITVGERGALPRKALLIAVRGAVAAGTHELIETPFFGVDAVLGSGTSGVKRGPLAWVITYRTTDPATKVQGDPISFVVTGEQIKNVLPDASLQGRSLSSVVALVMVGWRDGLSISELRNHTVTAVVRVEDNAEKTEDAPKVEDTGEQGSDADKATETPEDIKPVEVTEPAPVEVKTPELVPAESKAKTPAKPRSTRKPVAKVAK